MTSSNLIRWSGLAAILGGALLIVSDLLSLTLYSGSLSEAATTGSYLVDNGLRLLGAMLLLIGLVGLYAHQSETAGALGLVGFIVAFAGTSLMLGGIWTNTFVAPTVAVEAPEFLDAGPTGTLGFGFTLSLGLAALGWLLFGVATHRSRIYPRVAAALLVVGAVLTFAPLPGTGLVFGAAVIWLGFSLFSGQEAMARQPELVT